MLKQPERFSYEKVFKLFSNDFIAKKRKQRDNLTSEITWHKILIYRLSGFLKKRNLSIQILFFVIAVVRLQLISVSTELSLLTHYSLVMLIYTPWKHLMF